MSAVEILHWQTVLDWPHSLNTISIVYVSKALKTPTPTDYRLCTIKRPSVAKQGRLMAWSETAFKYALLTPFVRPRDVRLFAFVLFVRLIGKNCLFDQDFGWQLVRSINR